MGSAMPLADLDPIIHSRLRLAIVVSLAEAESADFIYLKDAIGTTDGNLSTHLSKLEAAGYIHMTKRFVEKKPRTTCRLTSTGRAAFEKYLKTLKARLSL